jgi:hypothetical protein
LKILQQQANVRIGELPSLSSLKQAFDARENHLLDLLIVAAKIGDREKFRNQASGADHHGESSNRGRDTSAGCLASSILAPVRVTRLSLADRGTPLDANEPTTGVECRPMPGPLQSLDRFRGRAQEPRVPVHVHVRLLQSRTKQLIYQGAE